MFRFNPFDHDREIDPEVLTPEEIEAVSDDMLELEEEYMPRKPVAVGLSNEEIREVLADVREEVRGMKLPKRRVSGKKKITPAHVAKAKAILKIGKRGRPTAEAVAKRLLAKRVLKAAGINPEKYLASLRYNKYVKGHAKPAKKKGKAKAAKKTPAKKSKAKAAKKGKKTVRMPKLTRMEALRMIAKHKRGRPGKLLDAAYKVICGK